MSKTRKEIVRALDEAAHALFMREELGHPGERVDQQTESEAQSLIKRAARLLVSCEHRSIALCDCPDCEAVTAQALKRTENTDPDWDRS
jgi:hypothetical protein